MKNNMDALAVMIKYPQPGRVKTRLAPPLSYSQAAALYRRFIADIFTTVRGLESVDIFTAYTPESPIKETLQMIPQGIEAFSQEGDGLGCRMYSVFKWLFEKDYKKVAIIGSDSPDLPKEYIEEAFSLLDENNGVVLGPAKDGGYYLIAMNRLTEAPFSVINWSTATVLDETVKRLIEGGLGYRLINTWHDIDTAEDLQFLKDSQNAPESSEFIASLDIF